MKKLIIAFYVFYVLMITYFSLTPIKHEVSESMWDKASHFIAYFILFVVAKKVHTKFNNLTCAIICCIYAFGIECIQYFIPYRDFEVLDMIANSLGVFLGVIVYTLFIEKYLETRQEAN